MKKIQWLILTATLYLVIITSAAFLLPDWLHDRVGHPLHEWQPIFSCAFDFLAFMLWLILSLGGIIFISHSLDDE